MRSNEEKQQLRHSLTFAGYSSAQEGKREIPFLPSHIALYDSWAPMATGVTAPKPVTTI